MQRREAIAAAADAKGRAEEAEEEKRQLEKAARKAKRKAEKQAEKERLQREAEERTAAQKQSAMYPVSKTSQAQGGRLVSCVGAEEEEEYEQDWDEEEAEEAPEPPRADGMDACFSDAILGQIDDFGSPSSVQKEELFQQIKAETRDTFVSYLCASLPSALLKKYPAEQLVGCLQTLMQELRRCVLQHGLEDVSEEEPTSVAEELRQGSRDGWLDYLQSMNPHALRQRFDLTELIDTFQALCQTCFDRLTDELGPMSRWVHQDSLLYVSPPAPPSLPPGPKHEEPVNSHSREVREIDMRESPTANPPAERKEWPERLSTAPASRSAAPRTDLPKAGPVFDATLGPALWEIQPGTSPSLPLPSTGRLGTGRLGSNLPLRPGTTHVTRPLLSR